MVELVTLQTISYIAGATSVCLGVIYFLLNMRTAERNKKIQLSLSITEKIGGKEFLGDYSTLYNLKWENIDDFLKKYDISVNTEASKEYWAQRHTVWLAYDNLGYLLRQGLLNEELVYNTAGFNSIDIWAKYSQIIDYYRRTETGPRWFENFEYLARRMWEMGKLRGTTSPGLIDYEYRAMFEPKVASSQ